MPAISEGYSTQEQERKRKFYNKYIYIYMCVVVQFYPWFKFHFLLFWGIEMYDNEFETKEFEIQTKDNIEPQHTAISRKAVG